MSMQISSAAAAYTKTKLLNENQLQSAANNNMMSAYNLALGNFNKLLQDATAVNGSGIAAANDAGKLEREKDKKRSRLAELTTDSVKNVYDTLKLSENISSKAVVDEATASDVVSTVTNAEIALQSIVAIRDKVINAYLDIIKMQI